jgi:exopolysaccharide biosynthesis polyprenyl glycosylphosphotransferase
VTTTSTPWVLPADAAAPDADPLRLIASTQRVDSALERARLSIPRPGLRPEQWLPAVDLVLAAVVLAVSVRLLGSELAAPAAMLLALGWGPSLLSADAWGRPSGAPSSKGVIRAGALVGLGCWVTEALFDPTVTSAHLLVVTVALVVATLLPRLLLALPAFSPPTRVTVTGDAADVRRLLTELHRGRRPRWKVASICLEPNDPDCIEAALVESTPVWTGTDTVVAAAQAVGASAVVIAPGHALCPEAARRLSWSAHCAGFDVLVATGLHDVSPGRARLVSAGTVGLAQVRHATAPSLRRAVKDAAERLLAAGLLMLLLPLLAIIAVVISLDSPGGWLYRQERVGRGNTTFTMYKFRTMTSGADQQLEALASRNQGDGVRFKIRQDPRVTRIGALLRRFSLDELPQLLNVLQGDMSLVGPRPALAAEVARYDEDSQHRLLVKPGLTGLWQVSGRSDLTWEESVRLDLHYVDNWSLGLDARIVLRTAKAVLGHHGAY